MLYPKDKKKEEVSKAVARQVLELAYDDDDVCWNELDSALNNLDLEDIGGFGEVCREFFDAGYRFAESSSMQGTGSRDTEDGEGTRTCQRYGRKP